MQGSKYKIRQIFENYKKTKQTLAHEITDDAFHPYKITY